MKNNLQAAWVRFTSQVPATERKLQLIMVAAAASFLSMSAIAWPGRLAIVGTIAGYISATCAGMGVLLQFAMQAQTIVETKPDVNVKPTTNFTEAPPVEQQLNTAQ